MKVLIVGAGAVGQVYGYHLHKAGHEIYYLVRKHQYKSMTEHPWRLAQIGFFSKPKRLVYYQPHIERVYNDEQLARGMVHLNVDVVLITVNSVALRKGEWVKSLLKIIHADTFIVNFTPNVTDHDFLIQNGIKSEKLIDGGISLASWQAPLPSQSFDPLASVVESDKDHGNPNPIIVYMTIGPQILACNENTGSRQFAKLLLNDGFIKGGLNARLLKDIKIQQKFLTGVTTPILCALEASNWSFKNLAGNKNLLKLTTSVMKDTAEFFVPNRNIVTNFFLWLFIRPFLLIILLSVIPKISPFDAEAMIKYHFTKVGEQTVFQVQDIITNLNGKSVAAGNWKRLINGVERFKHLTL